MLGVVFPYSGETGYYTKPTDRFYCFYIFNVSGMTNCGCLRIKCWVGYLDIEKGNKITGE